MELIFNLIGLPDCCTLLKYKPNMYVEQGSEDEECINKCSGDRS